MPAQQAYTSSSSGLGTEIVNPYHRDYQGNGLDWNWREVFTEDNPVSVLVLKPYNIDSLLDDRMSIWVLRNPANVELLHVDED